MRQLRLKTRATETHRIALGIAMQTEADELFREAEKAPNRETYELLSAMARAKSVAAQKIVSP